MCALSFAFSLGIASDAAPQRVIRRVTAGGQAAIVAGQVMCSQYTFEELDVYFIFSVEFVSVYITISWFCFAELCLHRFNHDVFWCLGFGHESRIFSHAGLTLLVIFPRYSCPGPRGRPRLAPPAPRVARARAP